MTNEIPFPPLHDPPPDELVVRRQHLLSEIGREPDAARIANFPHPGLIPVLLRNLVASRTRVLALAAGATFLAAGSSFALFPGSRVVRDYGHHRPASALLGLTLIPDSREIASSVVVKMISPISDASLEVQVLRAANEPGADPNSERTQVVFNETVPMTNRSPAGQQSGFAIWSGRLSVSDWNGGCQNDAIYAIKATVLNSGGAPSALSQSGWLSCSQGATG